MKTVRKFILAALAITCLIPSANLFAQEEEAAESPFSVGTDVVSSYVWRGTKFSGPAFQPYVEFATGGFAIGSWGSFGFNDQVAEADVYASYGFDFGLSLGVTDYYYQGTPYLEFGGDSSSHAFELNLGYEIGGFSIGANYILNETPVAGSAGGDMYFELGYGFEYFDIFVGAGDGWHTSDGEFGLCNIGIGTSKEVKITDSYSMPIFGQVIVNPEKETFDVVVGISF